MTAGVSLALIVIGAIMRWGITVMVDGANLDLIGLLLMIAGAVGLLVGLFVGGVAGRATRAERVADDRDA